jgi:hypothetical protein
MFKSRRPAQPAGISLEEYNALKRKHGLATPEQRATIAQPQEHSPSIGKIIPKKPLPKEAPKIDPKRIKPGF